MGEVLAQFPDDLRGGRIFQKLVPDEAAAPEPGGYGPTLVWIRVDAVFVAA